jgi:hypothetical protein
MKSTARFAGSIQNKSLASIIRGIVRIADPEIIFLLSASYNYQLRENIYIKNPIQAYSYGQYDLLLLSDCMNGELLAEKEIMIITRLSLFRNLRLQLMDIHEFKKGLEAGGELQKHIILNAMLSYDKGVIPLFSPTPDA